jgi:hypothetical protein
MQTPCLTLALWARDRQRCLEVELGLPASEEAGILEDYLTLNHHVARRAEQLITHCVRETGIQTSDCHSSGSTQGHDEQNGNNDSHDC